MKPLILHIGAHKTGTTTMQQFFRQYQQTLATHEVRYIPLDHMRREITPLIVRAPGDQYARHRLATFLATPACVTLLLSEENVLGSAREVLSGRLYFHAQARVRAIIEAVSPRPVTVFLTVRDPSTFLVSLYCEYLRNNSFIHFADFTQAINIHSFSFRCLFKWLTALPDHVTVSVLPFETEHGGGLAQVASTILQRACAGRGVVDVSNMPSTRSRATFSVEEIRLFEVIATSASPEAVKDFINIAERRGHRFGTERYQPLPAATRRALAASYRRDLSWLRRMGIAAASPKA